ncbi:MAG: beta-galactosidase, partial [Fibrobacteraceae bacterium]
IRPVVLRFRPVSQALAVTNHIDRFYFRKEELLNYRIEVRNRTGIPQEALLECTVCDFSDAVIGIRVWPVKLGGNERVDYEFAVTLPESGIFTVRSCLAEDGTTLNGGLAETKVAVLPAFDSMKRPDPRFGVGTPPGWCDRATMLAEFDLMREAGLGSVRTYFAWDELEPSSGKFTFERTDLIVDEAERRSLTVLPVISGVPAWAVVEQKKNRLSALPDASSWKTFLKTVFSRYLKRVPAWEIGDKPNFGKYAPKVYGQLLSAALSAAAEAGEPHPQVIVGGLSSVGSKRHGLLPAEDYLDQLYRCTSGITGVASHPYIGSPRENSLIENSFRESLRSVINVMKSHGDRSGLYLTEYSSSVCPDQGHSELDQARFLVVTTITGLVGDWAQGFFWSDFRNAGVNPRDSAMNYGLVNWDFSPKTALVAYSTLIDRLRFMKFKRQLYNGSDATAYVFENGSRKVVVAWTDFGSRTIRLPGASEVVDMVGRPELVTGENIEISTLPKYITIEK